MRNFSSFYDKHKNENIIVIGCGTSSNEIKHESNNIKNTTIGVNDIGDIYTPTYLLVVNQPNNFIESRLKHIQYNKCDNFITHLINDWKFEKDILIKIEIGSRNLSNFDNKNGIIDYSNNSPYMACLVAYYMGAKNIGLIGVDWTDNHFNNADGAHRLINGNGLNNINKDYTELYLKLKSKNCNLYNLSQISRLTEIPKISLNEFLQYE